MLYTNSVKVALFEALTLPVLCNVKAVTFNGLVLIQTPAGKLAFACKCIFLNSASSIIGSPSSSNSYFICIIFKLLILFSCISSVSSSINLIKEGNK